MKKLLVFGVFVSFWGINAVAQEAPLLAPVSCLIEPDQVVRLSTSVAGIVEAVPVERGDMVAKGEVVATLESNIEELAIASARLRAEDTTTMAALEARIAFLSGLAERSARLAASNAISARTAEEADLERNLALQELARAELDQALAELALKEAEALVTQKTLVSPITGVVVERLLNPGEYRDGQTHIATIASVSPLRVEAFVPIAYFDALSVGQKVRILPEAPLDSFREGRITIIDRVFDAATATVGVRMTLPNDDLSLPAGLRCTVYFE
ncbi:efflux RND transporter periplasmic adaptor subunit [Roseobacteraceae bacterium S113]